MISSAFSARALRRAATLLGGTALTLAAAAGTAAAQHRASAPWASSSGSTGAGLGLVSPQAGRFWAEGAFHTQDGLTGISPLLGLGVFVTPDVELEGMLPIGYANVDFGGEDENHLRLGAPYFGVNYVYDDGRRLRFKIGGGIAFNPVGTEGNSWVALLAASAMRGMWDPWLWSAQRFNLVAPFRIEYDLSNTVVFGGDAGFGLMVPTNEGDTHIAIQLAPGFGFRLDQSWLFGVRLAAVFIPTEGGENEQFSLEPYIRGALGSGFFLARFTLNLDEPYGFSFEEDEIWGLHVGGGVAW